MAHDLRERRQRSVPVIDPAGLERGIRCADRRAIARAITLVESSHPDHQPAAAELIKHLAQAPGEAMRVGLSGAPCVGKSTFIESFGTCLVGRGHRLAVLAVDHRFRHRDYRPGFWKTVTLVQIDGDWKLSYREGYCRVAHAFLEVFGFELRCPPDPNPEINEDEYPDAIPDPRP